ncbi:MinD/ParA family ATP-binding protein [Luteipulveratus mongoliensis]|uniref:MinD/ParA family ATP-binding protein n=1 Tax=Luteipulveratus mongoliensis TaxID=571913 RepID=UPI000696CD0F|nr:hypothetical protein [Luteipulveratus mongoliensis]
MALISVMSAKGSPGATTSAMLFAALWPRESVLVDADPMGGDVALRLPSDEGTPLRTDRGVLSLMPLARRGLAADVVLEHTQIAQGGQRVLTGLGGPEQAQAVGSLWDEIGRALGELPGADVIADVGQAYSRSTHLPLLKRSHTVICVVRPQVTGIVHARERLGALRQALIGPDGQSPAVGFVVVHDVQDQRETDSTARALLHAHDWLVDFGSLAEDPPAARMFDGLPVRRPERTMLVRSGREVVARVHSTVPSPHIYPAATDHLPPSADVPAKPARKGLRRRGKADSGPAPEGVTVPPFESQSDAAVDAAIEAAMTAAPEPSQPPPPAPAVGQGETRQSRRTASRLPTVQANPAPEPTHEPAPPPESATPADQPPAPPSGSRRLRKSSS